MNELPPRFPVLDVGVNPVGFDEAVDIVANWAKSDEPRYLSLCNAYTVIAAHDAPAVADIINRSSLSLPDGMPLVWLGRLFGRKIQRVYGPDLMLALSERAGLRHYFYGGKEDVVARLAARLSERFPHMVIAGAHAPPFRELSVTEESDIAAAINAAAPDIVWVGLGTPKQDIWIARNRPQLNAPVIIPVGAAFDFHSGVKPQAPVWMRQTGLEWMFRLLTEPRRLWRRYLINNPRFLGLLALQLLGLKQFGKTAPRECDQTAPAPRPSSVNISGVRVDALRLSDLLERMDSAVKNDEHIAVFHANAHLVNLAQGNESLRTAFNRANFVFCDGEGVRFASALLGKSLPQRFTPPDWIHELVALCARRGYGLFLLGSREGVAQCAADQLRATWPNLNIATHHGYFDHFGPEARAVIDEVNNSGARILLVGMGMPLQERWVDCWRSELNPNAVVSVGALFDYLAGRVPRGPRWMTDNGLEWAWRLVVEPRRLWRRYLIGNPKFIWRVVGQRLHGA